MYILIYTPFFFLCACVRAYVFIYTHLVSIPPTIPMGNEVSESASSSRLELHLKWPGWHWGCLGQWTSVSHGRPNGGSLHHPYWSNPARPVLRVLLSGWGAIWSWQGIQSVGSFLLHLWFVMFWYVAFSYFILLYILPHSWSPKFGHDEHIAQAMAGPKAWMQPASATTVLRKLDATGALLALDEMWKLQAVTASDYSDWWTTLLFRAWARK